MMQYERELSTDVTNGCVIFVRQKHKHVFEKQQLEEYEFRDCVCVYLCMTCKQTFLSPSMSINILKFHKETPENRMVKPLLSKQ